MINYFMSRESLIKKRADFFFVIYIEDRDVKNGTLILSISIQIRADQISLKFVLSLIVFELNHGRSMK